MQNIKEHIDRRRQVRVSTDMYDGTDYVRYFTFPRGDLATHRGASGELKDGAVLPLKWDGVSTTTACDPRLQQCIEVKESRSADIEVETHWISIDVKA